MAHCNFNLRAAESDGDEQLVRRICAENNITCHVQSMETEKYVAEHKVSIQVAARTMRYAFLNACVKSIILILLPPHTMPTTILKRFFSIFAEVLASKV